MIRVHIIYETDGFKHDILDAVPPRDEEDPMSIELRAPHQLPRLHERLQARLERAFARLLHVVKEVRATVRDINGPRGGSDQQASIAIQLVDGTVLFAEARAEHPGAALALAASRARRAALRRAGRLGWE